MQYFYIFMMLECEEHCHGDGDGNYCGLELYNFDDKCHLDCENEKIKAAERKFEPVHGNQCNGEGKM